jgi:hypothetical protein
MYGILMALGTVFILLSAFFFLTSGGNADRVGTARRTLIYAIVALVIAVLAGSAKFLVANLMDVELPDTTDVSVTLGVTTTDGGSLPTGGVPPGTTVKVSWEVVNATACSIACHEAGAGSPSLGSWTTFKNGGKTTRQITVDKTSACNASCTNEYAANGEDSDQTTIIVKRQL